jgi:hypothetical protein
MRGHQSITSHAGLYLTVAQDDIEQHGKDCFASRVLHAPNTEFGEPDTRLLGVEGQAATTYDSITTLPHHPVELENSHTSSTSCHRIVKESVRIPPASVRSKKGGSYHAKDTAVCGVGGCQVYRIGTGTPKHRMRPSGIR